MLVAPKSIPDELDLNINSKLNLTGAQLLQLSQALAYEGICEQKHQKYQKGLDMMLDIMWYATKDAFGVLPSDEEIWRINTYQELSGHFYEKCYTTHTKWENTGKYTKLGTQVSM